jgi:hypothetical protein
MSACTGEPARYCSTSRASHSSGDLAPCCPRARCWSSSLMYSYHLLFFPSFFSYLHQQVGQAHAAGHRQCSTHTPSSTQR